MFDNETIGNRIKELREKKGMTQQQFAELLHVSREKVVKIENGTRGLQIHDIPLIADVLDTDCDYLIRGIKKEHLQVASATGLSEKAISKLISYNKEKNKLNQMMIDFDRREAVEILLSSDEGQDVLDSIQSYINCDFTRFYTDSVNEDGDGFVPYDHSIGFKAKKTLAGSKYLFFGPDKFEIAAAATVLDAVKALKKAVVNAEKDHKA